MKKLLLLFVFSSLFLITQAQTDNEFWFVAPKVSKDHTSTGPNNGGKPIKLVFTNANDTTAYVTVYMPANAGWSDTTIIVPKKSTKVWDLTYRISLVSNNYNFTSITNKVGYLPTQFTGKNSNGLFMVSRSNPSIPTSRINITTYYESGQPTDPEIFPLKGRNALGTRFMTSFQTDEMNVNLGWAEPAYSAFDIVFTEDNTYIDIVVPADKYIYNSLDSGTTQTQMGPGTYTIGPFMKGETYSGVPAKMAAIHPLEVGSYFVNEKFGRTAKDHLAGVKITSRNGKKIAITLKDDSMKSLASGSYDLSGDQTVPIELLDTSYIAIKGQLYNNKPINTSFYKKPTDGTHTWFDSNSLPNDAESIIMERVYITAVHNNTKININGHDLGVNLSEGQTYTYPIPDSVNYAYINTSDTVYVYQVTGFGSEQGAAILPTIASCTGSDAVGFSRSIDTYNPSGDGGFYQNIMVRTNAKNGFLINGKPNPYISSSKFTDILLNGTPSGWSMARLGFSMNSTMGDSVGNYLFPAGGQAIISNTKDVFHLGFINGGSMTGARYGYFSNYKKIDPSAFISTNGSGTIKLCYGEGVQIFASGGVSFKWSPTSFLNDSLSNHPIVTPPTSTTYTATINGYCNVIKQTSVNIQVALPIKANYTVDNVSGCAPLSVNFHNQSQGIKIAKFWWDYKSGNPADSIKDYGTDQASIDELMNHIFTNTANKDTFHTFKTLLVVENSTGCRDSLKRDITVFPTVTTDITNAPVTVYDSISVAFNHVSNNEHTYAWDFGDYGVSSQQFPSHLFRNLTESLISYKTNLTVKSKYNCKASDSVIISVFPSKYTENVKICDGTSYKGHNKTGIYIDTLKNIAGTDSIVKTILTVNPVYNITDIKAICEGESYKGHLTSGIYVNNLKTISGCDSIVTIKLTVNPVYSITENKAICQGETYKGHSTSGIYVDSLKSVSGCDSIVTTKLTVNPIYNFTENKAICEGEIYKGHSTSGLYVDNLKSVSGCDSIVTTKLTVKPLPIVEAGIDQSICEGDSTTIQADGTGEISWLNLTGNPVIVTPGISKKYIAIATNSCGTKKDSLTIFVKSKPQTPQITKNSSNQLVSSSVSGNQWYNEIDGKINNAENNSYKPIKNGLYYVIVMADGCSSEKSNSFNYIITGISKLNLPDNLSVYPLPVIKNINIESYSNIESVQIINILGNVVNKTENINLTKVSIDMSEFKSGYYSLLIKIKGNNVPVLRKIVKQ